MVVRACSAMSCERRNDDGNCGFVGGDSGRVLGFASNLLFY